MNDASASTIAIISAVSALCAIVLGPLVALWAARRQSRAAVLSANRQAWINSLRDAVAEFISLVAYLSLDQEKSTLMARVERMMFIEAKVRLMLNPRESDHQQLIAAMHRLRQAAGDTINSTDPAHQAALATATATIVPTVQTILKREWERVKTFS